MLNLPYRDRGEVGRPLLLNISQRLLIKWGILLVLLMGLSLLAIYFGRTGHIGNIKLINKSESVITREKAAVSTNPSSSEKLRNDARISTANLQAMINAVPDSGGEVFIPSGTYLIDAVKSVWLKDNVTLTMAPDAILKAIPNNSSSYAVLQVSDVRNVKIFGGIILGERNEHLGTDGEWGMGVRITGSKDIVVQNTVVKDCWGDGFYIGRGTKETLPERIQLIDVQAHNNRRQGISLIGGSDVKIIRPRLTNTNGTPPAAGLDIEPNRVTDRVENIEIVDAYTAENAEGIVISLQKLNGAKNPISIRIQNHQDNGSGRGFLISSNDAIVPGVLYVEDSSWSNAKKNGLSIQNHDHQSFAINVIRPRIVDANRSGSNSSATGSAIAVYHFTGKMGVIGNISIVNPSITDTGQVSKTLSAFYISNSMGQEITKLSIIDPVLGGNLINSRIPDNIQQYIRYTR